MGPDKIGDSDVPRRLAAVLAADIAGYSRLMAQDEVGALNSLKSLRSSIVDPLVARHRGEIVGTAGDSLLVAFASAKDALTCALAWQHACEDAAAHQPPDRRMLFRIGIHLGDVIPEAGTIYGDGVNIASRLEKLAQPGGVVVSRAIRELVEGRLNLGFTDLGRLELKNIARPVEAFAVLPDQTAQIRAADPVAKGISNDQKLTIAVLPFANMSGDKEQEYFSDGITDDIITEISRFRELRVIARNSSFAFRGQSIAIGEIARRLGVQFVVEGSIRKAGNRLRITAQLIEAGSDRHIWADRYDRDMDDVFAIQDEIARTVATMAAGHVKTVAAERTRSRPTDSLSAYDLFLRARSMLGHYAKLEEIEAMLARAIELDPGYAMAHAMMANILNTQSNFDNDVARRERAAEFARQAIKLDPDEAWGHGILGYCLLFLNRVPEAGVHFERATRLNPNDVFITMIYGLWHCYAGHLEQAIAIMREALDRDPFAHDWFWDVYCVALVNAGSYEEALTAYERIVTPAPWTYAFAAIAHVNLGNLKSARELAARLREAVPDISLDNYFRLDPYVDPAVPDRLAADLRKAF